MVIESLITPKLAEKKPWLIFIFGIIFTSLSITLSLIIFRAYASLIMVFFIVMGSMPMVYNTIKYEELKDEHYNDEPKLLAEHWKALEVFLCLFLGITIATAFWFTFLPTDLVSDLFFTQIETIEEINHSVTGKVVGMDSFMSIFFNNIRVLIFCIVFSFLYGLGALFILTWNATVIGTAIGNIIRDNLAKVASAAGFTKVYYYFEAFSLGLLRYAPHGILEITAYFVAGLAGSLISTGIIRHNFGTKKFETILLDSTDLLIISVVILFFAGLIEVFVTPVIFS